MAVNSQLRVSPIRQAKARRDDLPRYVKLDSSRFLLGLVAVLCLMSLIALAQTGVVATKGYEIIALQEEMKELQRERAHLLREDARAQSLDRVRQRAEEIGLRPIKDQQVRYLDLPAVGGALPMMTPSAGEAAAMPPETAANPAATAAPSE